MEWFRDIEGFPDYNISDRGRVMNVNTGYIYTTAVTPRGMQIRLHGKYGSSNHLIQNLVADAFLGGLREGLMVKHVDKNITNNSKENLRIVAVPNKLYRRRKAKALGRHIPRESRPVRIKGSSVIFPSVNAAARELGVQPSYISRSLLHKDGTVWGYTLEYAERRSA